MLRKLRIAPEQDGYSVLDGLNTLGAILDGGAGRFRAGPVGAAISVRARWVLTRTEYRYMRAFFRTGVREGADPFLIDLVQETGTLTEHVARFVPGTMKLDAVNGGTYIVSALLEARPGEA